MLFTHTAFRDTFSSRRAPKRRQGLRWLALAVTLALGSIPASAWAKAPGETNEQVPSIRPATQASSSPVEARTTQAQEYASRESSAPSQAQFVGGGTNVWIGGSTLVIVLLVVLIVVLI